MTNQRVRGGRLWSHLHSLRKARRQGPARSAGSSAGPAAAEVLEARRLMSGSDLAFEPAGAFTTSTDSQRVVATGDFNGDGITDIVVGAVNGTGDLVDPTQRFSGGRLTVMLLDAAGNVIAQPTFSGRADAVVVGDFNHDHYDDIIVTDAVSRAVRMIRGGPGLTSSGSLGAGGGGLAVADLNHDGNLDFVVGDLNSNAVRIYMGRGTGAFVVPTTTLSVGVVPLAVSLCDVDGDGMPDLAVGGYGVPVAAGVKVFHGLGNGTFFATPVRAFTGGMPEDLKLVDVNSDGRADLVIADRANGVLVILAPGYGQSTWQLVGQGFAGGTRRVVAGDFNGDGFVDLAATIVDGNIVVMAQGLGGGRFDVTDNAYAPGPYGLAAMDFDRDGRLDLLVAQTGTGGGVAKIRNVSVPRAIFDEYKTHAGETLAVPQWDGVLVNDRGVRGGRAIGAGDGLPLRFIHGGPARRRRRRVHRPRRRRADLRQRPLE